MRLIACIIASILCMTASAWADNPFDLARKPKQVVLVTLSDEPATTDITAQPPMLQHLAGVLGELKGQQIVDLCGSVDTKPLPAPSAAGKRVCVVHISGPAGARAVRLDQLPDGGYMASVIGQAARVEGEQSKSVPLKKVAIETLINSLNGGPGGETYFGGFDVDAEKDLRSSVFEVPQPYAVGAFQLDAKTLRDRITGSGRTRWDATKRELSSEKLFARLPASYDPKRPAGLVIWMDPSPGGHPPQPFFKALDRYGFICIGAANAGNNREVADRLQLALDAVATAKRRWHIDPSRVYTAGVSGGGKMASVLLPGFPEVFNGAVPIVGLACYASVPTGQPGTVWAPEYAKPSGKQWSQFLQRRTAAVTGSKDFNQPSVLGKAKAMQADKVEVRIYDIEGMGHEFPTAEAFVEQLGWVDERARAAAEEAVTEAAAAMAKPAADRKAQLLEVVRRWPWTPAAWEAAKDLSAK
ncbi:MAG: hypothetical protein ACREJO_05075 [Phycisphaerales bacterium]